MADFPVAALRSVELSTPNLVGAVDFYTNIWGLKVVAERNGKVYLAATGDDFYVLELKMANHAALCKTTFRLRSADDLFPVFKKCKDAGCIVIKNPGPAGAPAGGEHFVVREPLGATLEFVHGDIRSNGKAIPNRPYRLAHVNINSTNIEALSSFWQNTLGFFLTDRSKLMAFLRCNNDHHAVVLAEAPIDGLNHVAFLMPDLESVMRGSGNLIDNGYQISWGVGRHGPGDNVFAYFISPDGVVIEYTAEVLQVDDTYKVKGPDGWVWPRGRTDHWGIAPPKSDICKKMQLSVPFQALELISNHQGSSSDE